MEAPKLQKGDFVRVVDPYLHLPPGNYVVEDCRGGLVKLEGVPCRHFKSRVRLLPPALTVEEML